MRTYFYPVNFISDTAYSYPVARLRALEARSISSEDYERMLHGEDEADMLRVLEKAGYENTQREKNESYGEFIHRSTAGILDFIEELLPEKHKWFAEYFRTDIDSINLKAKAKALIAGQEEIAYIEGGVMDSGMLREISPEECAEKLPKPYNTIWNEFYSLYSSGELKDYREASVLFDNRKTKHLQNLAKRMGSEFIEGFTCVRTDCLNIEVFFRMRGHEEAARYFAEGGLVPLDRLENTIGSSANALDVYAPTPYLPYIRRIEEDFKDPLKMQVLDRETARIKYDYLSSAKYVVFGPEVICAYYFRIKNELMNMKTIFLGRNNNIDREIIKEGLIIK
ncbi:V-type ATPase subunit [Planctomycetota bacterium]